jgi:(E)-4-hydroxy-3-methylbut-2-enyl-diphosphate synthase
VTIKTKTDDIPGTVAQIAAAAEAGCDIVRVTVNDKEAAEAMREIVKQSALPIVADIHFNHIFALKAIEAGVAKVRINPGNIGTKDRIRQVLTAAKEKGIPIRIGVNSGSLEDILSTGIRPRGVVRKRYAACRHLRRVRVQDVIISVKSTDVAHDWAYRWSRRTPISVAPGVTEAGTTKVGRSRRRGHRHAAGRASAHIRDMTDDPRRAEVGKEILFLGLASRNIELIACPTCGRLEVDLFSIMGQLEEKLAGVKKPVKIAVLGCVVNGPGEASEADIGIAAGKGVALLYRKGEMVKRVKEEEIVSTVLEEVEKFQPPA